jgi:hypothetical protein
MENKRLKPNFMISQGELMQLGDKAAQLAVQDQTPLLSYGVDSAYVTAIEDKTHQLKHYPTDEELEGKAMNFNEVKTQQADIAKAGIRTMMVKVKQVFKEDSGNWIRFGTKGMSEMEDLKLIKCGFRVVRMSNLFLTELAAKGVTQAMIDELETEVKNYDKAYDDQQDAKLLRKAETQERILLANSLYAMITELFDFGKDYWSTRNTARYKDYIIYESPSAKKKKDEKKVGEKTDVVPPTS